MNFLLLFRYLFITHNTYEREKNLIKGQVNEIYKYFSVNILNLSK